jgi:two-component system, NtrC family, sensor kinase
MLSRLFVGLGILMMVFAIFSGSRLLSVIHDANQRKPWYILFLLIIFFLVGYIVYFYLLFTTVSPTDVSAQLISAVFFFGALFVVLVLSVNYSLVSGLNEKTVKIQETNTTLTHDAETIQKKEKELEEIKTKLEKKNAELEKVLEDFYTIRIGMQKDVEAGKLEEENKKIKEQLDKLKNAS